MDLEFKNINEDEFYNMSMLFTMFSDSTRLKILSALFDGECCVKEIADKLSMTHSAISHQLSTLKKMRLVKSKKRGKSVFYTLSDDHIKSIFHMAYEHVNE